MVKLSVATNVKPSTVVVLEIVPRFLKLEFLKFQDTVVEASTFKLDIPASVIPTIKMALNNTNNTCFIVFILSPFPQAWIYFSMDNVYL